MTNEANIDIRVDDTQVEQLTRSLNALGDETRNVASGFDSIQDQARQAQRAMRGAGSSGSGLGNVSRNASQSSNALRGLGRSASTAARGLAAAGAGVAAAGAAAAVAAVGIAAAVAAWEGLKIGVDQAKQALVAYVSQSAATQQQFNTLKEASSQLQLQLGRLVLEVLGGNEAFELLNELIEAGAQLIETFTSAIDDLDGGLSATSVFLDLARGSAALLLDTIIFLEGAFLKLSTAIRLIRDSDYGFEDRRQELNRINEMLDEQRRIVDQLRSGTLDLNRMSSRDPIRLAVEGGSGGSGGGRSIEDNTTAVQDNTDALNRIQALQEEYNEKFDRNAKEAAILLLTAQRTGLSKPETQSLLDSRFDPYTGRGEGARRMRGALIRRSQSMESLAESTKRILTIDADLEDAEAEMLRLKDEEIEIQRQSNEAAQRIASNRDQIARNTELMARPAPVIPPVPDPVGVLSSQIWGSALGFGAVAAPAGIVTHGGAATAGAHAAGALGRRFPSLAGPAGRFIAGMEGVAIGGAPAGGFFGTAGRVVGGAGRAIASGGGAVVGGAITGNLAAREYHRLELEREAAIERRAAALLQTEQMQVANSRAQLENQRLARETAELEVSSAANQAEQLGNMVSVTSRLTTLGIASDDALQQAEASATDFHDSLDEGSKAYQIDLDERRRLEQQYFDYIRASIKGTKEEAQLFLNAIAGTSSEEAFRNLAGAGAEPARDLARETLRGGPLEFTEAYPVRPQFNGFGRDRGTGFRGIGTEFESRAAFLEDVADAMTPMEQRWARINGGVETYIKNIEDMKRSTRDAFKTDGINAFEESFISFGAAVGNAIGGGFEKGLSSGEKAKIVLFDLLGSVLTALGTTAIAQGGIAAFGDTYSGGAPNPARAAGLIAAGTAAIAAGTAFSAKAGNIRASANTATDGTTPGSATTPGGGGTSGAVTNIIVENRFGSRFDAREVDRAAAASFERAAAAGQA